MRAYVVVEEWDHQDSIYIIQDIIQGFSQVDWNGRLECWSTYSNTEQPKSPLPNSVPLYIFWFNLTLSLTLSTSVSLSLARSTTLLKYTF